MHQCEDSRTKIRSPLRPLVTFQTLLSSCSGCRYILRSWRLLILKLLIRSMAVICANNGNNTTTYFGNFRFLEVSCLLQCGASKAENMAMASFNLASRPLSYYQDKNVPWARCRGFWACCRNRESYYDNFSRWQNHLMQSYPWRWYHG